MLQFQQTITLVLTSSQSDLCLCCSPLAKSSFLAAISHNMNFSKDLVLKSDGRNSAFPNRIFLFKNCRSTALSKSC